MISIIYPMVDITCIIILGVILVQNKLHKVEGERYSALKLLLFTTMSFAFVETFCSFSVIYHWAPPVIYWIVTVFYMTLGATAMAWAAFIFVYSGFTADLRRRPEIYVLILIPFAFLEVYSIANAVKGNICTIDDSFNYGRGSTVFIVVTYVVHMIYYFMSLIVVLIARMGTYSEKKKPSVTVVLFTVIPVIAAVLQYYHPYYPFYVLGYLLACFIIFINDELLEREKLMLDLRQRTNETILTRCAAILAEADSSEETMKKLLRTVADYYDASYAFTLEMDNAENCYYLTYEWREDKAQNLFRDGIHIRYDDLGDTIARIEEDDELFIYKTDAIDDIPELKKLMNDYNVDNCLVCPIKKSNYTIAVLVIANCHNNIKETSVIRTASTFMYSEIQKLKQNEFEQKKSNAIIEALASEYSSVYYINLENEEFTPYRYDDSIKEKYEKLYRSHIDYTPAAKLFVNDFVKESDRAGMLMTTTSESLKEELKDKKQFVKQFMCTLNGKDEIFEAKWVRVEKEDGTYDAVLGLANKDTEIRSRQDVRFRNFRIIRELSDSFDVIYYIDVKTNEYEIFNQLSDVNTNSDSVQKYHNFFDDIRKVIDKEIYEKDRAVAIRFFDEEYFKKNLDAGKHLSIDLRRVVDDKPVWFNNKVVKSFGTLGGEKYIIGVKNVEEEKTEEIEKERNNNLIQEQKTELEKQRRSLEKALFDAETANRTKSSFLFNMSHDIRTPMNAIIGFTDMIEKHIDDKDKIRDYVSKVKTSSSHLLKLINEVLDMARIENGRIQIEESADNIYHVETHLNAILGNSIEISGLTFTTEYKNVVHDEVWIDRLHMDQILLNIMSNSIKYTKNGGSIKLTVTEIGMEEDDKAVYRFEITDTGIGIKEDFLTHVFDSFSREETATKSGVQGTGLGMAITKGLVDSLGGKISIQSKVGVGTTVTIDMPLRVRTITEAVEEKDYQEPDTKQLYGKRILLVDDNELNREIAKEILLECGMVVEEADDGDIACSMIQMSPEKYYDAVLMDVQMPHMDGYRATELIRDYQNGMFASLPIIAMTANVFEEDKQRALESGMNSHIGKPIDVNLLLSTLCKFID